MWKRRALQLMTVLLCLALLPAALPVRAAHAASTLATGYVNAAKLNMRKDAGTGRSIVDTLKKNTAVNIYEISGAWLRINVPSTGKSGYVSGKYISVNGASLAAYALGVTTSSVNLRKEATKKSERLAVVSANAGLTLYSADAKTGWYRVKVHATGKEGYISPLYIKIVSKVDPAGGYALAAGEIITSGVNFRTGPGTNYKSQGTLKKGTALTILEKNGNWYKVTTKGTNKTGYVFASFVRITSAAAMPTPKPTATPSPAGSLAGKLNAGGVNLRAGPSSDDTRLGVLAKNTPVTVLGSSGDWYRLTVNATGVTGYVFARYVTVIPATPTPKPTTTPSPAGSLAGKLNAGGVNLRTGPSTNDTSLGVFAKNTLVTVLGSSGDWYRLTVNATGVTGYVFARYVTVIPATPTPKPTVTPTPKPTATPSPAGSLAGKLNAGGVNLRTGPSTNDTSLGLLAKNTPVTVLGSSGDWYRLTVNATGVTGYVFARYVTIIPSTPTPNPTVTPTSSPTPTTSTTPTLPPAPTPTPGG